MPERLAILLHVVRVLLGHGRRFAETATARATSPQFATVAAVFGTHNLSSILARVQRGILHAIALERYLLARAEKGRDIAFVPPRDRPPVKPLEAAQPAATAAPRKGRAFDPDDLHIPTLKELEAEVRRRPLGRTIAYICMDLAVIPGFCTGEFWNQVFCTLRCYGGSLNAMYVVRMHREETFQHERDRRPETWNWNWRDLRRETVRQVLGCLIGEAPTIDPPGPLLATAPP